MRILVFVLLILSPAFSAAGEFGDYALGWTLRIKSADGSSSGQEQYLPDGRVIWRLDGGMCEHGLWWEIEEGGACFRYSGDTNCWRVRRSLSGFKMRPLEGGPDLHVAGRSRTPISCAEAPSV